MMSRSAARLGLDETEGQMQGGPAYRRAVAGEDLPFDTGGAVLAGQCRDRRGRPVFAGVPPPGPAISGDRYGDVDPGARDRVRAPSPPRSGALTAPCSGNPFRRGHAEQFRSSPRSNRSRSRARRLRTSRRSRSAPPATRPPVQDLAVATCRYWRDRQAASTASGEVQDFRVEQRLSSSLMSSPASGWLRA